MSDSSSSDSDTDDNSSGDSDEVNMRSKSYRARHMRVARLALPRQSRPVACNVTTDAEPSPIPFSRRSHRTTTSTRKTTSRFSVNDQESSSSTEKEPDACNASLSSADAPHEYPDPDGGVAFAVFDHPTSTEMTPFELGVVFSLSGLRRVVREVEASRSEPGNGSRKLRRWPLPWDKVSLGSKAQI